MYIAKQIIQDKGLKMNLERYLESYHGVTPRKPFRCINPDHTDNRPSMTLNRKTGTYCKCWSCGYIADIFQFIEADFGLTNFNDQLQKVCELYGVDYSGYTSEKLSKHERMELIRRKKLQEANEKSKEAFKQLALMHGVPEEQIDRDLSTGGIYSTQEARESFLRLYEEIKQGELK